MEINLYSHLHPYTPSHQQLYLYLSTLYTSTDTRKANSIMANIKENSSFFMTAPAKETIKQHSC